MIFSGLYFSISCAVMLSIALRRSVLIRCLRLDIPIIGKSMGFVKPLFLEPHVGIRWSPLSTDEFQRVRGR
jgi:hypothetical protein